MEFSATIHEDQADRKAYAKKLRERLFAFYDEHGEDKANKLLHTKKQIRAFVQDAIDKWGDDYASRLWEAAMTRLIIAQELLKK
jgi:hypothetical protein